MRFSGMSTWRRRNERIFSELSKLVGGRRSLSIVDYGPGAVHRWAAKRLAEERRPTHGISVDWFLTRQVDGMLRRLPLPARHFVSFEPVEICEAITKAGGVQAFSITVVDRHAGVGEAIQNSPNFSRFRKRIGFVQGNIEDMRVPADVVVALSVLPYVRDRDAAVKILCTSLRKHGILVSNKLTAQEAALYGLRLHKEFPRNTAIYIRK
jgi:hypothetical protein